MCFEPVSATALTASVAGSSAVGAELVGLGAATASATAAGTVLAPTIAASSFSLASIGSGIMAGVNAIGGFGTLLAGAGLMSGMANNNAMAKFQAGTMRNQQAREAIAAQLRSEDRERAMSRGIARARNLYGSIDPNSGTPLDVYEKIGYNTGLAQYADTFNVTGQSQVDTANIDAVGLSAESKNKAAAFDFAVKAADRK